MVKYDYGKNLPSYFTRKSVRDAGGDLRGGEIETKNWGERLFYASDPFGNALCFVEDATLYIAG